MIKGTYIKLKLTAFVIEILIKIKPEFIFPYKLMLYHTQFVKEKRIL